MCQLEDKKQNMIKLVSGDPKVCEDDDEERRTAKFKHAYLQLEQLREDKTRHGLELKKQIEERQRDLEQRQREDEELVKQTTRENLELKQEQENQLEELRCKLARLQVQVEELQTDRQEWLQYKNEGSIKDHQKIEKLEKRIASTQMNFQELSDHFQRSLAAAVEKTKQNEAQSIEDINHLALKRAAENLDKTRKALVKENNQLIKQVPLYINRVAVLESTVQQLEKENLEHVNNVFQICHMDDLLISQDDEFLAQSASVGSHDTRSMDRNIMKISLEETSALGNRPLYSLQLLETAEEAQQERDVTACDHGTTPSTPPDLSEMYSSQTTFTGAMHLDLLGNRLLCVIGEASPLHPPPNNPEDVSEEMTFDLLQTAKWPITTKIINRKFQQSSSESEESDVYSTCEIQQLLDDN
ncbi:unnamed protein product [Leuciscus chuanchicus]